MKYLYLDNFRGFSDTYIPIADVTFLVGENSTGKTSVLGLLYLFANPQFWFTQTFDTQDVRFGHFNDIVSVHAEDRRYFTVGMVEEYTNEKTGEYSSRGFLMTFKEKSGLPSLSHYTFNQGTKVRSVRRTQKRILIKESEIDCNVNAKNLLASTIEVWKVEHSSPSRGYADLPLPSDLAERDTISLPLLVSLLENITLKHDDDRRDSKKLHFQLPSPTFSGELVWLAPIRTTPKRTYDEVRLDFSPEGSHTPYLVRKILASKTTASKFKSKLEDIGRQSGLFEAVSIQQYGKSATAPFELDIVIDSKALNISTVGYGVSQSLPVIVELLHRSDNTWFAVQQPEVHLHPKAQAALGDLFYELVVQEKKKFLVETHSDFLIDRFRLNYRKKNKKKPNAQILFFQRIDEHNTATSLTIDEAGDLPALQPKGYRDFFIHEEMKILGF